MCHYIKLVTNLLTSLIQCRECEVKISVSNITKKNQGTQVSFVPLLHELLPPKKEKTGEALDLTTTKVLLDFLPSPAVIFPSL
jgi:hypothetical protein